MPAQTEVGVHWARRARVSAVQASGVRSSLFAGHQTAEQRRTPCSQKQAARQAPADAASGRRPRQCSALQTLNCSRPVAALDVRRSDQQHPDWHCTLQREGSDLLVLRAKRQCFQKLKTCRVLQIAVIQ